MPSREATANPYTNHKTFTAMSPNVTTGVVWLRNPARIRVELFHHCSLAFELFLLQTFSGNSAFPLRVVTAESPSLPMKWRVEGKVWIGNLKKKTKDGERDD